MIELGATEQDTTRRRANLSELSTSQQSVSDTLRDIANAFINARLLTTGQETIEVSHEALIREWARLSNWIHTAREDIRIHHAFARDVKEWIRHERSMDILYRGSRLAEVRSWAERNHTSKDEDDFISASLQLEKTEIENRKIQEEVNKRLHALRLNVMTSFPHELRTPLISIQGFTEVILVEIKDGAATLDSVRMMVEHIEQSSRRLNRITDKFLKAVWIAAVETDQVELTELRKSKCNTAEDIINNTCRGLGEEYERSDDIRLSLSTNGFAKIDGNNLQTIVFEIVDNALKFSNSGDPVEVECTQQENEVVIVVKDYGIGMTSSQIAEQGLFMQFERWLSEQAGMGMGLTLDRRLAEIYGGKLSIESRVKRYTKVEISIPS